MLFMLNFDANAQNMSIEEVIVSAEKRDESLQDISQSVTALTEEELEIKNITDIQAILVELKKQHLKNFVKRSLVKL